MLYSEGASHMCAEVVVGRTVAWGALGLVCTSVVHEHAAPLGVAHVGRVASTRQFFNENLQTFY